MMIAKKNVKLFLVLSSLLILIFAASCCSGINLQKRDKAMDTQAKAAEAPSVVNGTSNLPLLTYNVFTFNSNLPKWVDEKDDAISKYLENKFKIKVGNVINLQGMTFKERMNLFIASDDVPDVVCVYGDTVTCPSTGRYAELGDLIKQDCPNFMKYAPEDTWKEKLYNGKLYSMGALNINPLNYPDDPYAIPQLTWAGLYTSESILKKCGYSFTPISEINKQIKESGIKPSADTYKINPEIKTPDDLYRFFKKIKEIIPKVNGQDVVPFAIPIWLEPHFGNIFGLTGWWKYDPDTRLVSSFLTDNKSKDYWKFMNRLYNEGLLDKDFATQTDEQLNDKIIHGIVKCFMWSSSFPFFTDVQNSLKKTDPNDCLRALPLPVEPGIKPFGISYNSTTDRQYFISKDFKDIPRLLKYWDWLCNSKEGMELGQWGPEELGLWEIKDGKRVWKNEKMLDALKNKDLEYLNTYYFGKGLGGNSPIVASKSYNMDVVPFNQGFNPFSWQHSYKYEIDLNDFTMQANYVTAGRNDTEGFISHGATDLSNKVADFIFGEFEQKFSAKLFAAKDNIEFEKGWEEIQKYFNETIGYPQAKKGMEHIYKTRGFDVKVN